MTWKRWPSPDVDYVGRVLVACGAVMLVLALPVAVESGDVDSSILIPLLCVGGLWVGAGFVILRWKHRLMLVAAIAMLVAGLIATVFLPESFGQSGDERFRLMPWAVPIVSLLLLAGSLGGSNDGGGE